MKTPHLADALHCTGCGACANVCPVQAITMKPDVEGFIMPITDPALCVGCGLCEKTCPVLTPRYVNDSKPDCYAITASDDIRAVSSSGGFFTVAAEEVLNRGGVVFGAAWTDDWNAIHIAIDSVNALEKLRISKYVQSNVQGTYNEAKKLLDTGRPVLYSGTPCQIAGLYAYLKKDYSQLFTIEILCHGVPSPKVLQKYIYDNFNTKKIAQINCRDKTIFKWSSSMNIYFEDGSEYHKNCREDPFYKGFLPCMTTRNSCARCPFSTTPRQADITIGDYWGVERHIKGINDQKGLSAILINSQQGKKLFHAIVDKFVVCQRTDFDAIAAANPTLYKPFSAHPGRKHFFSSMDIKPFNQLVEDSLNHHYDIGIVGLWYGINYGSVLTYYALYSVLKEWGYDPVMLPKPNNMWIERYNQKETIAQRFIWKNCNVLSPYKSQDEYTKVNDLCKDFIVGSDVVWNYNICGREAGQFFFLDWVKYGHRKIGYACSCGDNARIDGPEEYQRRAKWNLRKFDAVSVREDRGAQYLKTFCGREDIQQVLDPVFLCNKQVYEQALNDYIPENYNKFVFAYLLNGNFKDSKIKLLDYASEHFSCENRISGDPNVREKSVEIYGDRVLPVISVESWLYHMKNCELFVGDSYHGFCFALIFHRPFVIFGNNDRVNSLLRLMGLEDRKISTECDEARFEQLLNTPINWDDVDARLTSSRDKSTAWFKAALTKKIPEPTELDFVKEEMQAQIDKMNVQLVYQKNQLNQLQTEYNSLIASRHRFRKLIAGGIQCCHDHGLLYTVRLFVKKIQRRLHETKPK